MPRHLLALKIAHRCTLVHWNFPVLARGVRGGVRSQRKQWLDYRAKLLHCYVKSCQFRQEIFAWVIIPKMFTLWRRLHRSCVLSRVLWNIDYFEIIIFSSHLQSGYTGSTWKPHSLKCDALKHLSTPDRSHKMPEQIITPVIIDLYRNGIIIT